uniref:Uncharacterized protein n=1 Tax=Arundo donax TaxID=35708 RepID=A0A0A9C0K3_ARUDO
MPATSRHMSSTTTTAGLSPRPLPITPESTLTLCLQRAGTCLHGLTWHLQIGM